jgi:uncharacterized protein (TIGR03083 family)
MATLDTHVPIVQTEAESLAQFLDTLSADDWRRPSACDLWTIRDVVAHLIWAADFYTDTLSRGMLIFTHIFGSSGILGSEDEQNP